MRRHFLALILATSTSCLWAGKDRSDSSYPWPKPLQTGSFYNENGQKITIVYDTYHVTQQPFRKGRFTILSQDYDVNIPVCQTLTYSELAAHKKRSRKVYMPHDSHDPYLADNETQNIKRSAKSRTTKALLIAIAERLNRLNGSDAIDNIPYPHRNAVIFGRHAPSNTNVAPRILKPLTSHRSQQSHPICQP